MHERRSHESNDFPHCEAVYSYFGATRRGSSHRGGICGRISHARVMDARPDIADYLRFRFTSLCLTPCCFGGTSPACCDADLTHVNCSSPAKYLTRFQGFPHRKKTQVDVVRRTLCTARARIQHALRSKTAGKLKSLIAPLNNFRTAQTTVYCIAPIGWSQHQLTEGEK